MTQNIYDDPEFFESYIVDWAARSRGWMAPPNGPRSRPCFGARAAREGRHPRTGQTIEIAASKAVRFHASKAVKDALNPPPPKAGARKKTPPRKKSAVRK